MNQIVESGADVSQRSRQRLGCVSSMLDSNDRFPPESFNLAAADAVVLLLFDLFEIGGDDLKLETGTTGIEDKDIHEGCFSKECSYSP